MHTNALKAVLALAKDETTYFCKLIQAATEVGVIVPSVLKAKLLADGYSVKQWTDQNHTKEGKAKHGCWLTVHDKSKAIVARAYSHDEGDALVQAIAAEAKSENPKKWASIVGPIKSLGAK